MKLMVCAMLLFSLSILLTESQFVPNTCQCIQTREKVRGPFVDIRVTPKGPSCLQNEIIVKRKNKNAVCLSPGGRQGKRLLKCWQQMEKAGMDPKKCVGRKRKRVKSKRVRS
ncbi:hypothetical protein DNTS_020271 [Danionella cerebrum]|uniref:Chemokine interleukin-8-like domain-containing protein n=1 Tax=Danionella cerebrum TaxID=2873325 RepID=A0A553MKM4_9TELE|nr:hypothetical protein DNTS_020271 [Danionella translucida]